jgi:hypothetical protein
VASAEFTLFLQAGAPGAWQGQGVVVSADSIPKLLQTVAKIRGADFLDFLDFLLGNSMKQNSRKQQEQAHRNMFAVTAASAAARQQQ